jgi:hypothetical protein
VKRSLLVAAWLAAAVGTSHAASLATRLCDQPVTMSAAQQDKLLRFAAVVRQELEASGQRVALVARSGLNLDRFGVRYSHAGLSLQASPNAPWSVRQLYYACDERRPRLFDQGLPGFVFGTDDASLGYVSLVLLPAEAAAMMEAAALDRPRALRLLAERYSANAYPFSLAYQNCNQWLIELFAAAWGQLPDTHELRAQAQAWLQAERYEPATIELSRLYLIASHFIPWVHADDHPEDDLFALRYRLSLPSSIESFVRARAPQAERIELCHNERQIVVRRGWLPIAEGCVAEADDRVVPLD